MDIINVYVPAHVRQANTIKTVMSLLVASIYAKKHLKDKQLYY